MGRGSLSAAACVAACVLLASGTTEPPAESKPTRWAKRGHKDVLYAAPGDLGYAYGPRNEKLAALTSAPNVDAPITVTFNGFTAEAQAAFQAAVNIWSHTLNSSVPIRIRANWTSLGAGVLGSAGPTVLCSSNAFVPDTWYATALADKLNGSAYCAALGGETHEIEADFNSDFEDWEFGTSGVGVPNQYNFMTVVLHEIGHGLGIFGQFTSNGTSGNLPGNPAIYDRFAVSGANLPLLDFTRPSAALHAQLTGNDTYWSGSSGTSRNGGTRPKLETHHFTNDFENYPSSNGWVSGSSYSHVDDVLYTGTANGLMTWRLNSNEAYTDVGPITKGILQDQGWSINEALPGAPTLLSPSGATSEALPDFVWSEVSGATEYNVYVRATNSGSPIIDTLYAASSVCSGGTCTLPTPVSLAPGTTYQWWVRGSNTSGYGDWSTAMTFTITVPVPIATSVTAPSGSGAALRPTFTWNVVSGATYYYLSVMQGATQTHLQWYHSPTVCTSTCSVTPTLTLTANTAYTVRVQTWNPTGYGPWSSTVGFTTGTPPSAPTLVSPSGSIATPGPTYTWNVSSGATSYYLWVQRNGSSPNVQTTYSAATICSGSTCAASPQTELVDGTYQWWVQPISGVGAGAWSAAGNVTVSATVPTVATLQWPLAGAQGTTRPTYRWNRVAGASWYQLWVDPNGAAPVVQITYWAGDICGATVCSVTPNVTLTAGGTYRYFVQTSSSRGTGPWSPATVFSIATTAPGISTLVSPTGGGIAANPTYTWNRVSSSTWYYLWVQPVSGNPAIQVWYRAEEVCGATTCSVTPATSLAAGQTYRFWIQTFNDFGYGPWSAANTFSR
jgi:hypothetical protein